MKKALIAGGVVVGVLVVALVTVSFFLGSIVKTGVNTYGPRITQTSVRLAGASISPFSGSGSLRGLVVGNPKGWSSSDLVSVGRIHVAVAPRSLFTDRIVIKDIEIDAPVFDYETRLVSSNVGDLLKTVEHQSGSGAATAKTKSGKPIHLEVRHFALRDGVVRLGAGKAAARIPLPPLELSNIGLGGGVSPAELAAVVMRSLTDDIVRAVASGAGRAAATAKAAATQQLNNATKSVKQKAEEKVKGLLGGKR